MPTESIVFSPEIDERGLDREVNTVNDKFADAASGLSADISASMDSLRPAGSGGGGGLASAGNVMLALDEQRNDLLEDIRESLSEDFVGGGRGGGGKGGVLNFVKTVAAAGAGGVGGGAGGIVAGGLAAGGGILGTFLSGLTEEQRQQTVNPEDTRGAQDTSGDGFTPPSETGIDFEWPEVPDISFSWPEVPDIDFSWPDVPDFGFEWPSLPDFNFSWPEMPSWMDSLRRTFGLGGNRSQAARRGGGFQSDQGLFNAASRQNRAGGRPQIDLSVDQPRIDLDPGRLVSDLTSELEPLIRREVEDLRRDLLSDAEALIG